MKHTGFKFRVFLNISAVILSLLLSIFLYHQFVLDDKSYFVFNDFMKAVIKGENYSKYLYPGSEIDVSILKNTVEYDWTIVSIKRKKQQEQIDIKKRYENYKSKFPFLTGGHSFSVWADKYRNYLMKRYGFFGPVRINGNRVSLSLQKVGVLYTVLFIDVKIEENGSLTEKHGKIMFQRDEKTNFRDRITGIELRT